MKIIERYKRWRKTDSRWQSFWFAIDDCLEKYKWYKFYYQHIWSPIWRVYDKVKHIPRNIRNFCLRGKRGVSPDDIWGFQEYSLQVMYYGVKEFIYQEYGTFPNWELRQCETHNRRLYEDLVEYMRYYERYHSIEDVFDPELEKVFNHLVFLYQKITREHLHKLWI